MMYRKPFVSISLAVVSLPLILAIGCENEESQTRRVTSDAIIDATRDYTSAVAATDAERESELNAIAGSVASYTGSNAASMLSASVRLDLAQDDLAEAATLEAANRVYRASVSGMAAAANRLGAAADAHRSFDTTETQSAIESRRSELQTELEAVNATLDQLTEPIAQLESENEQAAARITELRTQSRDLRDQAFEAGDLEGHPLREQAVQIDKEADRIEAEMTFRDLQLADLESQRDLAQAMATQLEARIAGAGASGEELEALRSERSAGAQQMQQTVSSIGSNAGALENNVAGNMQALEQLYTDAEGNLDAAVEASSSNQEGVRLIQAAALQERGRLNSMKAAGLADHAMMLDAMGKTGGADLRSRADEAANQATADYQEAIATLQNISNAGREIALLRQLLNQVATGEAVDYSQFEPDQPAGVSGASAGGGQPGAATPEELAQMITSAAQSDSFVGLATLMNLLYTDELPGNERQIYGVMRDFVNAGYRLEVAVQSEFGATLADLPIADMAAMSEQMAGLGSATISNVSGDTGILTVDGQPTEIRRINGRWFIVPEEGMGADGGAGGEEMEEFARGMMEMLNAMFGEMARIMDDFATRVQNGEFATLQELNTALEQEMPQMDQSGFGGGF